MSSGESRKKPSDLAPNLVAGTLTGMTTITLTNPLDTLKCRWQVLPPVPQQELWTFASTITSQEGLWTGLWRPGLPPNVMAMGCSVGLRYGLYPSVRDGIGWMTTVGRREPDGKVGPVGMFAAGLLAGASGYFIASPFLQIKTQMQAEAGRLGPGGLYETGARAGMPPSYTGTVHALRTLAAAGASDGGGLSGAASALWRGAGVIVGRGAALSASQLMAYDFTKTTMKNSGTLDDGPMLQGVASMAASIFCTTCSMPFDVVQTLYQSARSLGNERQARYGSAGPLACAALMMRETGPFAFLRGWVPAFVRLAPTSMFSFWLYEQLRRLVGIGYLD